MSPAAAQPLVSVVIPTYNRCDLLGETLRQLTRQSIGVDAFEVVVADDGSSDDTAGVTESFAGRLRIAYHSQEDLGFRAGTARNGGARLATAPILVFLDTGQMAGPDFLRHHLAAHDHSGPGAPGRAVVGYAHGYNPAEPMPGIEEALRRLPPEDVVAAFLAQPAFRDIRHDALATADFDLSRLTAPWVYFWTMNCSVRAADFRAVAGFDEDFQGWGMEDIELGYRLFRHGTTFHLSRDAWVLDAPHERDWPANLTEQRVNMDRLLAKYPEPTFEVGWALCQEVDVLRWDEDLKALAAWSHTARDLDVRDEIKAALRNRAPGERVAIIGAGPAVTECTPPAVLIEFDSALLARALATGRHTGHHAIGLRTPLPDQAVDTVVVTSRLAGLWDRWRGPMLAEAHRIGRTVRTFESGDTSSVTGSTVSPAPG